MGWRRAGWSPLVTTEGPGGHKTTFPAAYPVAFPEAYLTAYPAAYPTAYRALFWARKFTHIGPAERVPQNGCAEFGSPLGLGFLRWNMVLASFRELKMGIASGTDKFQSQLEQTDAVRVPKRTSFSFKTSKRTLTICENKNFLFWK